MNNIHCKMGIKQMAAFVFKHLFRFFGIFVKNKTHQFNIEFWIIELNYYRLQCINVTVLLFEGKMSNYSCCLCLFREEKKT